jgi:probable HAF family extracellular repeat protein
MLHCMQVGMFRPRAQCLLTLNTLLIFIALFALPAAADIEYQFVLIEAFDVDYDLREVMTRDINEAGLVAGTATHNGSYDGFVWTQATEKQIVPFTWPAGLNNSNQIVADRWIYDLVSRVTIGVSPAGAWPTPRLQAINDHGIAVGYSECACSNSDRILQDALIWDAAGGSRTIPVTGAKELLRINNENQAVGNIRGGSAGSEGFIFDLDTGSHVNMTDLLPSNQYGRGFSELMDLNESGVVTGRGWDGHNVRGLTWSAALGFKFLPALSGGPIDRVYPRGINGSGVVVGFADDLNNARHAFIWSSLRGMRDLNALVQAPSGFILDWAIKINENGWIVGIGHYGPNWGTSRGFVLKPASSTSIPSDVRGPRLALGFSPNPATHELVIRFSAPDASFARLTLFDVSGRQVARLFEGLAGTNEQVVSWRRPSSVAAGVYYVSLATQAQSKTQRVVLR